MKNVSDFCQKIPNSSILQIFHREKQNQQHKYNGQIIN